MFEVQFFQNFKYHIAKKKKDIKEMDLNMHIMDYIYTYTHTPL